MVNTRSKRKADAEIDTVGELPSLRKSRKTEAVMKKNAALGENKTGGRGSSALPEKLSTAEVACSTSPTTLNKRSLRGKQSYLSGDVVKGRRLRERRKLPKVQCKRSVFRNLKKRRQGRRPAKPVATGDFDGEDLVTSVEVEVSSEESAGSSESSPTVSVSHASNDSAGDGNNSTDFCTTSQDDYPTSGGDDSEDVEENSEERSSSSSEGEYTDEQPFPRRVFATDRYPTDGRVNSYSKLQYLVDILDILDGNPQFQTLMDSCFCPLFKLHVRRCLLSGKLVHNFICRQVLSKNSHELWFTFGGYPLRFSLREFEVLTGLPCDPYPAEDPFTASQADPEGAVAYWEEIVGSPNEVTIKEIVTMLKAKPEMEPLRRLRLVLIVIVEGILICGTQPISASFPIVQMLRDLNIFFTYPWGRLAFERTLRMIKVGENVSRVSDLTSKLRQKSVVVHGFPIAIQLLLLRSIPLLLRHLPFADDEQTFLDRPLAKLPTLKTFHKENILQIENDPALTVHYIVPPVSHEVTGCLPVGYDSDPKIRNLVTLIEAGYPFSKRDWRTGDASLPLLCICKKRKNLRCKCPASLDVEVSSVPADEARCSSECPAGKEVAKLNKEVAKLTKQVAQLKRGNESQFKKIKEDLRKEMVLLVQQGVEPGTGTPPAVPRQSATFPSSHNERIPREPAMPPIGAMSAVSGSFTGVGDASVNGTLPVGVDQQAAGITSVNEIPPVKEVGEVDNGPTLSPSPTLVMSDLPSVPDVVETFASVEAAVHDQHFPSPSLIPEDSAVTLEASHIKPVCPKSHEGEVEDLSAAHVSSIAEPIAITADAYPTERMCPTSTEVNETSVTVNFVLIEPSPLAVAQAPPDGVAQTSHIVPKRCSRRLKVATVKAQHIQNNGGRQNKVASLEPDFNPFAVVHKRTVQKFMIALDAHPKLGYDLDGCEVSKNFFKELFTPQQWVFRTHMDFMIRIIWKKRGSYLSAKGVGILDSLLTQLLASQYCAFLQADKHSSYVCHPLLGSYVDGTFGERSESMLWFKDVSTIYVPMNWGNKHWVGLVIYLNAWHIEILDPLVRATSDRKVSSYMAPLVKMLPHLIKATCDAADVPHDTETEFSYSRLEGLAQNVRTGDCGPLCIKFLELHSLGWSVQEMGHIDDHMVDYIRMPFAVNVYEEFYGKLTR